MSTQLNGGTVRTYRGRSLEEIIPRIRAELGPDAIILREREGLTGGLNGFFAQRCVEVDAQAPPLGGVDFYDEDDSVAPGDERTTGEVDFASLLGPDLLERRSPSDNGSDPAPAFGSADLPADAPASPQTSAPASAPANGGTAPVHNTAPALPATPGPMEELSFAQRVAAARRERVAARRERASSRPAPEPAAPRPAAEPAPAPAPAPAPTPAPSYAAAQLDGAAAGAVARELIGHGISEAWAHELIVSAAAHLTPFAPEGGLRDAVRYAVASSIIAAPPLPSSGAAVAFVGAGGSGKTRCAAALAAAYARASTLRVSVVALGDGARAGAGEVLAGRDVPVRALDGDEAAEAVADGRERGLVVLDTPGTSPVDADAVAALAEELDILALDAVVLAVPATLSASAARSLLDRLAPLQPSALVITHADETDELGIVTELAYQSGLPIAFIHGGLQLDSSLTQADPVRIAARLLP